MTALESELRKILRGAVYLKAAYAMGVRGRQKPAPGQEPFAWVEAGGAAVGVYRDPEDSDLLWAAIRGTMTLRHWRRDFQLAREPARLGPGSVHRGGELHGAYCSDGLERLDVNWEGQRVAFADHSLGSLAGPHVALLLDHLGARVERLDLFGMPRDGDEVWARFFSRWCLQRGCAAKRIVAIGRRGRQDPVTRVPFSRHGWWHLAPEGVPPWILDEDGRVYTRSEDWERVRQERRLPWWMVPLVLTRLRLAVGAHSMDHYIAALERALERARSNQ